MEHLYHLMNSRDRPWLTLKVVSKAPAPTYIPSFHEGDAIGGSVTINLRKEESIKAISIQVNDALSHVIILVKLEPSMSLFTSNVVSVWLMQT